MPKLRISIYNYCDQALKVVGAQTVLTSKITNSSQLLFNRLSPIIKEQSLKRVWIKNNNYASN